MFRAARFFDDQHLRDAWAGIVDRHALAEIYDVYYELNDDDDIQLAYVPTTVRDLARIRAFYGTSMNPIDVATCMIVVFIPRDVVDMGSPTFADAWATLVADFGTEQDPDLTHRVLTEFARDLVEMGNISPAFEGVPGSPGADDGTTRHFAMGIDPAAPEGSRTFVDLATGFASIERRVVQEVMERTGLPPQLVTGQSTGRTSASNPPRSNHGRSHDRDHSLYVSEATSRAQQAGAERRRQQAVVIRKVDRELLQLDWTSYTTWQTASGDRSPQPWVYQINQMQDEHLWKTLVWLCQSVVHLYKTYTEPDPKVAEGLASKRWLVKQPAFRGLLAEAIRRKFTFPSDVFHFIRQYAVTRNDPQVLEAPPWRDPNAGYQATVLSEFELHPPEEFGKPLRRIDLK